MKAPVLSISDLSIGYDARAPLFQKLSLELFPGQLLFISGPNGSGKSSLLRAILQQKDIRFLSGTLVSSVEKREIEWIPQIENQAFHIPLMLKDVLEIGLNEKNDIHRATSFKMMEPSHFLLKWNEASGGERKRTLLTRSLLNRPKLLLLDEPMNHLDPDSRKLVIQALADYLKEGESSAVVVSHEPLTSEERKLFAGVSLMIDSGNCRLEPWR